MSDVAGLNPWEVPTWLPGGDDPLRLVKSNRFARGFVCEV